MAEEKPNNEISPLEKMEQIEDNEIIIKCCNANLFSGRSIKESLKTLNRLARDKASYKVFVKYNVRKNVDCCKGKNPHLVRYADKVLDKLGKMETAAIVHEEAKRKRIHELAMLSNTEQDNDSKDLFGMKSQSNEGFRRQESGDKRSSIPKRAASVVEREAVLNSEIRKVYSNGQDVIETATLIPPQETSPRSYKKFSGKEDMGFIIIRQREIKEKLSKMNSHELLKELNEHPDRASYCDDLFIRFLHHYSESAGNKPDGYSYKTWYEALKQEAEDVRLNRYIYKRDQEKAAQVVKKTQFIDVLPPQAPKRRNYNKKAGPVSKRNVAKNGSSTERSSAEGNSPTVFSMTAKPAKPTTLAPGKLFMKSRKMAQEYYAPYYKPVKAN